MNAKTYKRHVQKEILPAVQRLYKHKNWVFVQGNAAPHRSNLVQDFFTINTQFTFYQNTGMAPVVT